jgi:hypothetical protein
LVGVAAVAQGNQPRRQQELQAHKVLMVVMEFQLEDKPLAAVVAAGQMAVTLQEP